MMRRLLLSIAMLFVLLPSVGVVGLNSQAAAVDVFPICKNDTAKKSDVCQNIPDPGTPGENPIIRALKLTIEVLSIIIGITAVIMVIIGGMTLITANGDAQAVARARKTIAFALIGLAIAASAGTIVAFVLNRL